MWNWEDFKPTIKNINHQEMSIIDTLSALQVERLKRGISQREFAQKIGMKQSQLARIENVDSIPSLKTLERYAAGLGFEITMTIRPSQTNQY